MNNLPFPLLALAQHLFAPPPALDFPHFCPSCRNTLPLFVADELAGELVDGLYPEVTYHLDRCQDCLREYTALSILTRAALFDEETP